MQSNPSPAQARILREMRDNDILLVVDYFRSGKIRSIQSRPTNANKETITKVTLKIIIDNGWVDICEPNDSFYTYDFLKYYKITQSGIDSIANYTDEDFISPPSESPIFSTSEIVEAMRKKYEKLNYSSRNMPPKYIYFNELRGSTGFQNEQRIDFWVMNCWPSSNFEKTSFEIKVYRSDFLKEIKNPEKRQFALSVSNYFYFLTPPNLISLEELPEECGLMEMYHDGFRIAKKPPFRESECSDWGFVASIGRNFLQKP